MSPETTDMLEQNGPEMEPGEGQMGNVGYRIVAADPVA